MIVAAERQLDLVSIGVRSEMLEVISVVKIDEPVAPANDSHVVEFEIAFHRTASLDPIMHPRCRLPPVPAGPRIYSGRSSST